MRRRLLIHDHICKVCNRPAPEGSDAYEFMVHKLEDYKRHVEAKLKKELEEKEIEDKSLFKSNHIESLHSLSISLSGNEESQISNIATEINERQELVARLREDLKKVEGKLQDIMDEKSRLLIQAGNVSESVLEKDFNDINLKSATFEGKEILPGKDGIYRSQRSQKQVIESFVIQNPLTP